MYKLRKDNTANKIKVKLDIYSNVRPSFKEKSKEQFAQKFLSSLKKQNMNIERLHSLQLKSEQSITTPIPYKEQKCHELGTIEELHTALQLSAKAKSQKIENTSLALRNKLHQTFRKTQIQDIVGIYQNDKQSLTQQFGDMSMLCENHGLYQGVLFNDIVCISKELESKTLTEKRNILNKQDNDGATYLFYAVQRKYYEASEVLLRNGSETLLRDKEERTPLHYAVLKNSDKKLIQLLMDYNKLQNDQKLHLPETLKPSNFVSKFDNEYQKKIIKSQQRKHILHSQNQKLQRLQQLSESLNQVEYDAKASLFQSDKDNSSHSSNSSPKNEPQQLQVPSWAEQRKQHMFEIKLKSSKKYKNQTNKFVNMADKYGRTALHYAAKNDNLELVQLLIKNQGNLYARDDKEKIPSDYAKSGTVKKLLEQSQNEFFNSYNEKQSLRVLKLNDSRSESTFSNISLFSTATIFGKQKIIKNLQLGSVGVLAQYSNNQLSQYCYGLYQDNALTYTMRLDDKPKFEYLLKRGILPSGMDKEGQNALHYAVKMGKIEYLSYMLEGDYYGHENTSDTYRLTSTLNNTSFNFNNKSLNLFSFPQSSISLNQTSIVPRKQDFIVDALLALCQSSYVEGTTPFHEAARQGNTPILRYLFKVLKFRNEYLSNIKYDCSNLKSVQQVLEFTDSSNNTALLIAAQNDNFEALKFLIDEGANPYVVSQDMNNCLHYAVIKQNEEMVKFLIFSDAESNILKYEKNARNKRPSSLDKEKKYQCYFQNPWELVTFRTPQAFNELARLFKPNSHSNVFNTPNGSISSKYQYKPYEATLKGQNTPLHFAILHNNQKAARFLYKLIPDKSKANLPNADGKTPKDFITMYKSENKKSRLLMLTSSDQSLVSQRSIKSKDKSERERSTSQRRSKFKHRVSSFNDPDEHHLQEDLESEDSMMQSKDSNRHLNTVIAESKFASSRDLLKTLKDEQLNVVESSPETLLKHQETMSALNTSEIEDFISMKEREYQEGKRLGNFNPELYKQVFTDQKVKVEKQPTCVQEAYKLIGLQDQFTHLQTVTQKQLKIEELYKLLETKGKQYIEYYQIREEWRKFEEMLNQAQLITLQLLLERQYKNTKITKANFLKIMSFYINDK